MDTEMSDQLSCQLSVQVSGQVPAQLSSLDSSTTIKKKDEKKSQLQSEKIIDSFEFRQFLPSLSALAQSKDFSYVRFDVRTCVISQVPNTAMEDKKTLEPSSTLSYQSRVAQMVQTNQWQKKLFHLYSCANPSDTQNEQDNLNDHKHSPSLSDFQLIWTDPSDATKHVFSVHKLILAAHCDYFRSLLFGPYSDPACQEYMLSFPFTVSQSDIQAVLIWIYTGILVPEISSFQLFDLADYWCLTHLAEQITKTCFQGLFIFQKRKINSSLHRMELLFMATHFDCLCVMGDSTLKLLNLQDLQEILSKLDFSTLNPEIIYYTMMRWLVVHEEITYTQAVQLFSFWVKKPLMPDKIWMLGNAKLLTAEQCLDCISQFYNGNLKLNFQSITIVKNMRCLKLYSLWQPNEIWTDCGATDGAIPPVRRVVEEKHVYSNCNSLSILNIRTSIHFDGRDTGVIEFRPSQAQSFVGVKIGMPHTTWDIESSQDGTLWNFVATNISGCEPRKDENNAVSVFLKMDPAPFWRIRLTKNTGTCYLRNVNWFTLTD